MSVGGIVIGGVMCLLGTGLFVGGVRKLFSGVSLYRNATVSLRNIPQSDGAVEFDGQADPTADHGSFEAPFSGEEALLCEIWMEQKSRMSKHEDGEEGITIDSQRRVSETETTWGLAETDEIRRPFAVSENGARVVVDPTDADLDIHGHMGEVELGVGEGETLSEDVRERLRALDAMDVEFDCSLETWDAEDEARKYREARLEPGEAVHVTGAAVESLPEEWGSGVEATVGASETDRFLISRGTESDVVRRHLIQFVTGVVVGLGLLGLGGRALWLALSP